MIKEKGREALYKWMHYAGIHAPTDNAGNAHSTDTDDTGSTKIQAGGSFYNSDHEDNTDNLNNTEIVYNSDYNLILSFIVVCTACCNLGFPEIWNSFWGQFYLVLQLMNMMRFLDAS